MKQREHFSTHIQGIPCGIRITSYFRQKPLGWWADSDYDAMGYTEAEYTVLNYKGYPAPWLVRKITEEDNIRSLELIDDDKEHETDD